jgi:tight adherence protein B
MIALSAAAIFAALFLLVLLAWPDRRVSKSRLGIERKPFTPGKSLAAMLERWGQRTGVQHALVLAGIDIDAGTFMLRVLVASVLLGILGLLVSPLLGLVLTATPFLVTRWWVGHKGRKRQEKFAVQLPDFLQSVVMSVRSGFGLSQTLEAVAGETQEPMRNEIERVLAEVRMGQSLTDSLHALSDRMDNPDLDWVIAAVEINRETGGNLSEILTTVNTTLRDRQRLHRKVRTFTAEGRLSARILTVMPFIFGFWQWRTHPDGFNQLLHFPGAAVLLACGVLIVVGWFWIRRIVTVKI